MCQAILTLPTRTVENGWYTTWMYIDIPWQIVGSLWIFAEASGKLSHYLQLDSLSIKYFQGALGSLVVPSLKRQTKLFIGMIVLDPQGLTHRGTWYGRLQTCCLVLFYALIENVVLAISKLVLGLLIALTLFLPSTTPSPRQVFFAWHIYETHTARRANRNILVAFPMGSENVSLRNSRSPEDDWGFGQLLPFFLLPPKCLLSQRPLRLNSANAQSRNSSASPTIYSFWEAMLVVR